jgi:hypothetical protein
MNMEIKEGRGCGPEKDHVRLHPILNCCFFSRSRGAESLRAGSGAVIIRLSVKQLLR